MAAAERARIKQRLFSHLTEQGDQQVSVLTARPGGVSNAVHTAYLQAIEQAHSSIHIVNAYFMPDEAIKKALCRAAERGVEAVVILPGVSDFTMTIHGQRYHYGGRLERGAGL